MVLPGNKMVGKVQETLGRQNLRETRVKGSTFLMSYMDETNFTKLKEAALGIRDDDF